MTSRKRHNLDQLSTDELLKRVLHRLNAYEKTARAIGERGASNLAYIDTQRKDAQAQNKEFREGRISETVFREMLMKHLTT